MPWDHRTGKVYSVITRGEHEVDDDDIMTCRQLSRFPHTVICRILLKERPCDQMSVGSACAFTHAVWSLPMALRSPAVNKPDLFHSTNAFQTYLNIDPFFHSIPVNIKRQQFGNC